MKLVLDRDYSLVIRYREFDIENPPHDSACAHKISLLLVANSFSHFDNI